MQAQETTGNDWQSSGWNWRQRERESENEERERTSFALKLVAYFCALQLINLQGNNKSNSNKRRPRQLFYASCFIVLCAFSGWQWKTKEWKKVQNICNSFDVRLATHFLHFLLFFFFLLFRWRWSVVLIYEIVDKRQTQEWKMGQGTNGIAWASKSFRAFTFHSKWTESSK